MVLRLSLIPQAGYFTTILTVSGQKWVSPILRLQLAEKVPFTPGARMRMAGKVTFWPFRTVVVISTPFVARNLLPFR